VMLSPLNSLHADLLYLRGRLRMIFSKKCWKLA